MSGESRVGLPRHVQFTIPVNWKKDPAGPAIGAQLKTVVFVLGGSDTKLVLSSTWAKGSAGPVEPVGPVGPAAPSWPSRPS